MMKNLQVFFFFFLFSVLMRFFSLFPSVINHDESTYLVIANSITHGAVYLKDFIDTKPPGIFYLFAFLIQILGKSIFLIRLAGCLFIAGTAFLLFLSSMKLYRHRAAAIASGAFYILAISIFTYYGISLNTESFFNFFTAVALLLFLTDTRKSYLFAGIAFGIGAIIKYVVLFDGFAFVVFALIVAIKQKSLARKISQLVLMGIGFSIPIAMLFLYYAGQDALPLLLQHTFRVGSGYQSDTSTWTMVKFYLDFHARFLPFTIMLVLVLIRQKHLFQGIQVRWFYIIWYVSTMVSAGAPQNFFGHYFIQALLPLCFITGHIFIVKPNILNSLKTRPIRWAILIALIIGLNGFFQWNDYARKPDYPKIIARDLANELSSTDILYTGNYQHIIYFLLDRDSPTPYVHRSLLERNHLATVLGFDRKAELKRLAEIPPDYYISKPDLKEPFKPSPSVQYQLMKAYPDNISVYKRSLE